MLAQTVLLAVGLTVLVGCGGNDPSAAPAAADQGPGVGAPGDEAGADGTTTGAATEATDTSGGNGQADRSAPVAEEEPTVAVDGIVFAATSGSPLAGAVVTAGDAEAVTDPDGTFSLVGVDGSDLTITVARSGWQTEVVELDVDRPTVTVELRPFVARGLRVARPVAADPDRFGALLALAEGSTVNTLVFDTKDESGFVQYETEVDFARSIAAVDAGYDPAELLALARERGLYTVTRVVTFEDRIWAAADPEAKLAGRWVDATDEANWRYPIDLAIEACRLGFQEIQFDYVRYPAGRTADAATGRLPPTGEARAEVIAGFLEQATAELRPLGCGTSAAIFGIVMSSPTDEGIGQTVEAVSGAVDVVSPMIYPSHYNKGWLGFADPNAQPGPVVADAMEQGGDRLAPTAVLRPWLQAFYYNGAQVRAQIDEAEKRGAGWLLWNANGNYREDWLPPS